MYPHLVACYDMKVLSAVHVSTLKVQDYLRFFVRNNLHIVHVTHAFK